MKLPLFKKKNEDLIKKESSFKRLLSYKSLYILVLLIILSGFGYLGYYIYNNYYQTITQSKEVEILRSEVAPDFIDTTKVERVIGNIDKKTTTQHTDNASSSRSPFTPYGETSSAPNQPATTTPAVNPAE